MPVEELGRSKQTAVWQVEKESSGGSLALKISLDGDPARRLEREYALLERFKHPGIVSVHEFGKVKDIPWFTMDFVDGLAFDAYFAGRRKDKDFLKLFLGVLSEVIATLSAIHREGIVHADLKPLNLLVDNDGNPVLLDFGFAEDFLLVPSGEPRGTLLYVAPELFLGEGPSPASDLYSLGVMAYEVLAGRNLWSGLSPRELIAAKATSARGLRDSIPWIPAGIENILLRLLEPDPALRPAGPEIAEVLRDHLKGKKAVSILPTGIAPRLVFGAREVQLAKAEQLVFEEKQAVYLEASKGEGKTRFMRELRFRAIVKGLRPVYIEGRSGHLTILEHLAGILGEDRRYQNDETPETSYERLLQTILKAEPDALLIDSPADINDYEKQGLGYIAEGLRGRTGLIVSGSDSFKQVGAETLELPPLERSEIRELITRTFDRLEDVEGFTDTIFFQTQGNPARIGELLDVLYSEGWLRFEGIWVFDKPERDDVLEEKISLLVRRRLDSLPSGSGTVLGALAIAQNSVPLAPLVSAFDDIDTVWITRGLSDRGLVSHVSYLGLPHYELSNQLLKEYILQELSLGERRSLCARMAKWLERYCRQLYGEDRSSWSDSYLVEIARLFLDAGNKNKAPSYLIQAGKKLSCRYLYRQAKELLTELVGLAPEPDEKKAAFVELGRIADIEQEAQLAEQYYLKALALADDDRAAKGGIMLRAGLAHQRVHDLDRADELFNESEELMGFADSQLLSARGWNAMMRGDYRTAETLFDKSLERSEPDSEIHRRSLYMVAWVLFLERKYDETLKYAKEALARAEAAGDKGEACQIRFTICEALTATGKLYEAQEHIEKTLEVCREMDYTSLRTIAMRLKAMILGFMGNYRKAKSLLKEALAVLERVKDTFNASAILLALANQSRNLGEWDEAESMYRKLWMILATSRLPKYMQCYALFGWSHLYLYRGNIKIAYLMAKRMEKISESAGDEATTIWALILLCRIALASDDKNQAIKMLDDLASHYSDGLDYNTRLNIQLLNIELTILEENAEQAQQASQKITEETTLAGFHCLSGEGLKLWGHALMISNEKESGLVKLRESADLFKRQENPFENARSLGAVSEATFQVKGYCDEAVAPIEEASVIFERLGAKLELDRIDRFRARHFTEWRTQPGLPQEYLDGFKKISELINYRLGEEDFMLDLLTLTLRLTGAERGIIFLMDEAQLYAVASKRIDSTTQSDARRISKTVIKTIQQGLQPIFTKDATTDERFSRSRSIYLHNIRSILCIPLKTSERLLGTIYLDSQSIGLFDLDKVAYFEALGNLLAATIDKSAEFSRLKQELVLSKGKREWEESGFVRGNAKKMRDIYNQLEKIAMSEANVLLEGETGTGKGVLARIIHEKSPRRRREFCSINCGILPENIFESELFGTRKGAYTGALSDRIGLLETADGSTVFFDEITNTSLPMQAKLLEVIDERVIRRFGESRKKKVNLRFIFATNRNLKLEVKEGRFREDLYFRLNTLNLTIPPLRERREDVPELTRFFIEKFSRELNKQVSETSEEVMEALIAYPWPGNIRELANVIERAVLLAPGRRITRDLLDQRFFPEGGFQVRDLREAKRMEEQELIRRTLLETGGNVTRAAKRIGVTRQHLSRLISRHGIHRHPNKL